MNHVRFTRGRPRSAAKHRVILEAAGALVAEVGYHATTMEAIARRAGVGKMTLYRWWPSKPALLLEVYEGLVTPEAITFISDAPVEDLRNLLRATFRIFRETPAAAILAGLIADAQHDRAARDAVTGGVVSDRRELLTEPLKRAAAAGRLSPLFDPAYGAEFLAGMIWHRLLTEPDRLDTNFADQLVATLTGKGGAP